MCTSELLSKRRKHTLYEAVAVSQSNEALTTNFTSLTCEPIQAVRIRNQSDFPAQATRHAVVHHGRKLHLYLSTLGCRIGTGRRVLDAS